ncbi:hypothetical protein RHMOL_Rhmol07G0252400 [Rhododendron molle]|uniref:Uncharacterized protein n=1 Tax=Rhododendron molle TaxID=49168 RepID=A0ACC0N628_RHOML|nr:hypothetical protein RHMOL_Rhmol07G0252400 [Rhododendron molle]
MVKLKGNESEVALEDEDVELGLLLRNNVYSTQECREVLGNRDHCKETLIRGTSPPSGFFFSFSPRMEQNDHQLWRCVQGDLEADNGIGINIKLVQALYARIMYHNCGGNVHYWLHIKGRRCPYTLERFLDERLVNLKPLLWRQSCLKGNESEVALKYQDVELGLLPNSPKYPKTTQEFREA